MFSFSGKERRSAWIKSLASQRSSKIQPVHYSLDQSHELDVISRVEQTQSDVEDSLSIRSNPVLVCDNSRSCSDRRDLNSLEGAHDCSFSLGNDSSTGVQNIFQEEASTPERYGGLGLSVVAGGVTLGAHLLGAQLNRETNVGCDAVISTDCNIEEQSCQRENSDRPSGQVSVNLNALEEEKNTGLLVSPSTYLRSYYDILYYCGISSYKLDDQRRDGWSWWIVGLLHKGLFLFLVIMSAFQSLALTKMSFLFFVSERGESKYYSFVEMTFNIACFAAKLHAACLLSLKKRKTEMMFMRMEEYNRVHRPDANSFEGRNGKLAANAVRLLAVITIAVAVLRATIGFCVYGTKDMVTQSSEEFSRDIFIWNSEDMNRTLIQLKAEYGTNVTTTTISMASVVMLRDASAYLQMGMLFDLVVVMGMVMYLYTKALMKEIKQVTPNTRNADPERWNRLQNQREVTLKKYRQLKEVNDAINEVFDPLLKLLHLSNLMRYAFFMILIVFWDASWIQLALYAVDLVKTELGYFVAGRIAEQNDDIRAWIRNWACHNGRIKFDDEELDAHILMDELDRQPIGLGKGKFHIHQTFHYKFLGLVLSVFFSLADEES